VVEADDVKTTVSGDMALLTAFLTYRAVDASGQELRSLDNRLSWVARQRGGRWQVVHEHTSVPIAHAARPAENLRAHPLVQAALALDSFT
jgi:ketosteroid isomerase-like protein